jgi:hypothetical protein
LPWPGRTTSASTGSRRSSEASAISRSSSNGPLAERAATLGTGLPPADQLATLLIALTNGMAVEQLADPGSVPQDLYGRALDILLG